MELSDSKIKKFLIFLQREIISPSSKNKKIDPENISCTSGNRNPEKKFIFSKESLKLFLHFGKRKPQKILYISGNFFENQKFIKKQNFLI